MGMCNCKATRFEFNLNSHIRFKPTKLGKVIFRAHWMPFSKDGKGCKIKTDTEGWAEMQLWEFMHIFGPSFGCGMSMSVETTVTLIDETAEQIQALQEKP